MTAPSGPQYSAPRYYEIAFDMNRRQEGNFLVHCFRRYARRRVRTVLDIACGPGPHLIRLAGRGYVMSGLDLSPQNIAFLKDRTAAKGFDARLLVADMTRFHLPRPVDAAICMQDSQGHLLTNEAILAHLRCVGRALRRGGLYVFDRYMCSSWTDPARRWSGTRRPGRATSLLHSRVSRPDRPAERGNHATRLQQRGHARPPTLRRRPMQCRCRVDEPVALARPHVLERGLHGLDGCRHVPQQFGEHGPVRLGRGYRDPPASEQAGGLARPGTNLKGSPNRLTRVGQHHVEELHGIPRPEPLVCFRPRSEAQCATRHAEHPDTTRAITARSFRATRQPGN